MKSVICVLVIFILIVTMVVTACVYTNNITEEMLQSLYKNENYISKTNWQMAHSEVESMDNIWQDNRNTLVILFNHNVIEKVDLSIAKTKKTIQMQKKEDFFYESKNLELLLKSLVEQQEISIGNVF